MFKESKKTIKKDVVERMESYLPEWKGDNDLGMALVDIFSSMQEDTLKNYEKLRSKWCINVLNCLNTSLKPKNPAKGYVSFGLSSDDVGGVNAPAKLLLRTDKLNDNDSEIPIETMDDVYVTPSKLTDIWSSKGDYITELTGQDNIAAYSKKYQNLQKHSLYLSHSIVLNLQKYGEIALTLFSQKDSCISREQLELCFKEMEFLYSTENGFVPFKNVKLKSESIVFELREEDAGFYPLEIDGVEDYWIQCQVKDGENFLNLSLRDIKLNSRATGLLSNNINANGLQMGPMENFYPFSERPSIYDETYFACDEALSKSGAVVELSFMVEFAQVLLDIDTPNLTDWKLVMPKSNVKIEEDHDITINEVVFEYFNGNGYVNLFDHRNYNDIFGVSSGTGKRRNTLRFVAPKDISKNIVGGVEGYYIRARILKMNNALKTNGKYITPMISQLSFAYQYLNRGERPEYIVEENNLEMKKYFAEQCLENVYPYQPIKESGNKNHALYFGFDKPLDDGPIRILFDMEKKDDPVVLDLSWQYLTYVGFQELHVADETMNLRYTGLVSFQGVHDHRKKAFFGKELYWIRVVDSSDTTDVCGQDQLPLIKGIYLNSVGVMAIQTGLSQYLTLEEYESPLKFNLDYKSIYEASVYVNETSTLSSREEELIKDRITYKEVEDRLEKWVLWKEVDEFVLDSVEKRVYKLDSNNGELVFSRSHALPSPTVYEGIYIELSVGGGEQTNLDIGEVNAMDLTVGYINQVTNPLPLSGGTDKESVERASKRKWAEQKHGFRAVTARDYEEIVKAYSVGIHDVKCFSNYDLYGNKKIGDVTLVLLLNDYKNCSTYFNNFKVEILHYLKDKIPVNLLKKDKLHVITPQFVKVCIAVDLCVNNFNDIFTVKREVNERLNQFLDPIKGNFSGKGFEIGKAPNRNQIEAVIKDVPQVQLVKNLMLIGEIRQGNTVQQFNLESTDLNKYILPCSGKHSIEVFVE